MTQPELEKKMIEIMEKMTAHPAEVKYMVQAVMPLLLDWRYEKIKEILEEWQKADVRMCKVLFGRG